MRRALALLCLLATSAAYADEPRLPLRWRTTFASSRSRLVSVWGGEEALCAATSLAVSPDGRYVVANRADAILRAFLRTEDAGELPEATAVSNIFGVHDLQNLREIGRFVGHDNAVHAVAFSRDGRRILSTSYDGTTKLWDHRGTADARDYYDATGAVVAVLDGPEGRILVIANTGSELVLQRPDTLEEVRRFAPAEGDYCRRVAISAEAQRLLGAGQRDAYVWDVTTGREVARLRGHDKGIQVLRLSPDGRQAITIDGTNWVRLWDATHGNTLLSRGIRGVAFLAAAFSPDGRRFLLGGSDGELWLFDRSGAPLRRLQSSRGDVHAVAFTPDGRRAVVSHVGMLAVWDLEEGREVVADPGASASHADAVTAVCPSADGETLLSSDSDGGLLLWDVATGRPRQRFRGHKGAVLSASLSRDGRRFASAGVDGTVRLWEVGRDVLRTFLGHDAAATAVALQADGKRLLSGDADGSVRLWNNEGLDLLRLSLGSRVTGVAVAADGRLLAAAGDDGRVRLWDAGGAEVRQLGGHTRGVTAVSFSADGKRLLTASKDRTLRLWDVATGQRLQVFAGHDNWVTATALSPDGSRVLSASDDGTVRLWRASDGEEEDRLDLRSAGDAPTCVAFAADGKTFAVGTVGWAILRFRVAP